MAFQQFTFPQVIGDLGLTLTDTNLFATVADDRVSPDLQASIDDGANIASAINTEKARSEFVIAPVLMELRRRHAGAFSIFSGVELVADANRGLNGICDFLLAKPGSQHVVSAPIFPIVEAKNDNPHTGLGQCIATLVAARILNEADGKLLPAVYGVSTTGSLWKFLQLSGAAVTIDTVEYSIHDLGKILAILGSIVTSSK